MTLTSHVTVVKHAVRPVDAPAPSVVDGATVEAQETSRSPSPDAFEVAFLEIVKGVLLGRHGHEV